MLSGEIEAQLYTKPTDPGETVKLQRTRKLISGDVIHIRDNISVHSMSNVSNAGAVTLHLYTPPYDTTEIFRDTGEHQPKPRGTGLLRIRQCSTGIAQGVIF